MSGWVVGLEGLVGLVWLVRLVRLVGLVEGWCKVISNPSLKVDLRLS